VRFRQRRREALPVNLTPLIDVVFLLLIFFMVSTSFSRENQLQINLPTSSTEAAPAPAPGLSLSIHQDGSYALNGRVLSNARPQTLLKALRQEAGGDLEQPLLIIADSEARHQAVVSALDAAAQLGLGQVRLATQTPPAPP